MHPGNGVPIKCHRGLGKNTGSVAGWDNWKAEITFNRQAELEHKTTLSLSKVVYGETTMKEHMTLVLSTEVLATQKTCFPR